MKGILTGLGLLAAGLVGLAPMQAMAEFPEKPITIIVPFTPGGATDVLARLVAENLTGILGQQVIVENKPGASGTIGTRFAAEAPADGYTLLIVNALPHTASSNLFADVAYDPVESFRPIGFIGTSSYVVTVTPSFPANTIQEFVDVVKAAPGQYSFGTAGPGSSPHLGASLFLIAAGLDMIHVPYQGTAVTDVMGGHVNMTVDNAVGVLPYVTDGTLKALATTGAERSPLFPDLPTLIEAGFGDVKVESNFGLLAPAATPEDVMAKLSAALTTAVTNLSERLEKDGMTPRFGTGDEFKEVLLSEQKKWSDLIKQLGITAQ